MNALMEVFMTNKLYWWSAYCIVGNFHQGKISPNAVAKINLHACPPDLNAQLSSSNRREPACIIEIEDRSGLPPLLHFCR